MKIFRYLDVGLVTRTGDGMNLVAKESVAAQDPANPGVLFFAICGAANELTSALIVNPYDRDEVVAALDRIDYVAGGTYFPSCRNAGSYRETQDINHWQAFH